jgi:hypothetical protein
MENTMHGKLNIRSGNILTKNHGKHNVRDRNSLVCEMGRDSLVLGKGFLNVRDRLSSGILHCKEGDADTKLRAVMALCIGRL